MDPDGNRLQLLGVHAFIGALEQLPSNQIFGKQISGHKKGSGVRQLGQWVG